MFIVESLDLTAYFMWLSSCYCLSKSLVNVQITLSILHCGILQISVFYLTEQNYTFKFVKPYVFFLLIFSLNPLLMLSLVFANFWISLTDLHIKSLSSANFHTLFTPKLMSPDAKDSIAPVNCCFQCVIISCWINKRFCLTGKNILKH